MRDIPPAVSHLIGWTQVGQIYDSACPMQDGPAQGIIKAGKPLGYLGSHTT